MAGPVRTPIVAGLILFALSVGSVTLLWYLPVSRRWWSLALMVLAAVVLPAASGFAIGYGLRGYVRDRRRQRAPAP
jgi:hypothetical protein